MAHGKEGSPLATHGMSLLLVPQERADFTGWAPHGRPLPHTWRMALGALAGVTKGRGQVGVLPTQAFSGAPAARAPSRSRDTGGCQPALSTPRRQLGQPRRGPNFSHFRPFSAGGIWALTLTWVRKSHTDNCPWAFPRSEDKGFESEDYAELPEGSEHRKTNKTLCCPMRIFTNVQIMSFLPPGFLYQQQR